LGIGSLAASSRVGAWLTDPLKSFSTEQLTFTRAHCKEFRHG